MGRSIEHEAELRALLAEGDAIMMAAETSRQIGAETLHLVLGPLRPHPVAPERMDLGEIDDRHAPSSPSGEWTAAELQALVGGWIEVVSLYHPLGDPWLLVVNEEGALLDLEPNLRASALAGRAIVGPAVLTTREALGE